MDSACSTLGTASATAPGAIPYPRLRPTVPWKTLYALCARAESASRTVHPMKKALILSMLVLAATAKAESIRLAFEGTQAIHKLFLKDLGPDFVSDWSAFQYLVLEIRTST